MPRDANPSHSPEWLMVKIIVISHSLSEGQVNSARPTESCSVYIGGSRARNTSHNILKKTSLICLFAKRTSVTVCQHTRRTSGRYAYSPASDKLRQIMAQTHHMAKLSLNPSLALPSYVCKAQPGQAGSVVSSLRFYNVQYTRQDSLQETQQFRTFHIL